MPMSTAQGSFLRRAKSLLRVLVFIAVALIASLAAIENTDPIRLRLLGFESAEVGVFWWLLLLFVVGLIIGRLSRRMPRE